MRRYVVSLINFYNNENKSIIVSGDDEALTFLDGLCRLCAEDDTNVSYVEDEYFAPMIGMTVDQIKSEIFNGDMSGCIIFVPDV
jgi:hypothetical protein